MAEICTFRAYSPLVKKHSYKNTNVSFNANFNADSLIINTAKDFSGIGQIQADFIKAIGKATLSPLFILMNPFVKTDKISRKYSAILQPIEAMLAFGCSTIVNLTAGLLMDVLAKQGRLGHFFDPAKNPVGGANLSYFKDRTFVIITILAIPITSSIINYLAPKIIRKIYPEYSVNKKGFDKVL